MKNRTELEPDTNLIFKSTQNLKEPNPYNQRTMVFYIVKYHGKKIPY